MKKNTIETATQEVAEFGWKLLSEEYKSLDTEMEFLCPEGHRVFTTLKKFRSKQECPMCKSNPYKDLKQGYRKKNVDTARVLALDQATNLTGFAIFDNEKLIHYGTYHTHGESETARIEEVKNWVVSLIKNWKPDRVQIEDIQLQTKGKEEDSDMVMGVTTYKVLAHLQGVLFNLFHELNIPCEAVFPSTWRKHCQIKGKTRSDKKRNAQLQVKDWYDVSVSNDEADAICIGRYASSIVVKNSTMINWG